MYAEDFAVLLLIRRSYVKPEVMLLTMIWHLDNWCCKFIKKARRKTIKSIDYAFTNTQNERVKYSTAHSNLYTHTKLSTLSCTSVFGLLHWRDCFSFGQKNNKQNKCNQTEMKSVTKTGIKCMMVFTCRIRTHIAMLKRYFQM